MKVCFKKFSQDAQTPYKKRVTDAGFDLFAQEDLVLRDNVPSKIKTGIGIAIPPGHVGIIHERSGLGSKGVQVLGGVIDEGYTGEILVCLLKNEPDSVFYSLEEDGKVSINSSLEIKKGHRIAQLLIQPVLHVEFEEVHDFEISDRGASGFGDSGR